MRPELYQAIIAELGAIIQEVRSGWLLMADEDAAELLKMVQNAKNFAQTPGEDH